MTARGLARVGGALALVAGLALATGALGCHGGRARHGGAGVDGTDDGGDEGDLPEAPPLRARDDTGSGPLLDVGAFSARFPEGFPDPKRSIRNFDDGYAVAFVSATTEGVCLVLGADQDRGGAPANKRSLRSFEHGLAGDGGRMEAVTAFRWQGLEARTALFTGRDSEGERTYWRYLGVVDGPRLYAAIFMSKHEKARRTPAVERFLSSLRIGSGPMPTGPNEEDRSPKGPDAPKGPGKPPPPGETKI